MRIAYFGGSFDPPHEGHLGVALGALRTGRTDRVWFSPVWLPPHKPGRRQTAYADRTEMVKLLIAGKPELELCTIEGELKHEPSYTMEILEELRQRFPADRIQLLIGGDSLRDLHTWHRATELAENFEILAYPRDGATPDREYLRKFWPEPLAEKLAGSLLSGDFFRISSTELRKSMAGSAATGDGMEKSPLDAVQAYVESRQLYRK